MAKKERIAIKFVKRLSHDTLSAEYCDVLFAVTGMPERTIAPKETAHYILFNGTKNKRYKMKINTVEFAKDANGKIDRTKIIKVTPNFIEVKGKELDKMYAKCCPAFKRTFPR